MATVPTHAFAGLVITDLVAGAKSTWPLRIAGAACAALPDADVFLMRFANVAYEDPWGHRGISHGLPFAIVVGVVVALLFFRKGPVPVWRAALALVLATASQGLLDAMTTGGLGVAFLAPFSYERFFLPWDPIPVAPLSIRGIFTAHGADIVVWELVHIWFPLLVLLLGVHLLRRRGRADEPAARALP